ncbi:MAG: transposase [Candidatus Omnitrophica bacterium]|nr:transposase [Candidatus Omnitrophota bacterium]
MIRRFLQHVLPSGFHRVRRFGWLHPSAKAKREHIQALLADRKVESTGPVCMGPEGPDEEFDPFDSLEAAETFDEVQTLACVRATVLPPRCPRCNRPMQCIGHWHRGQLPVAPSRDPP